MPGQALALTCITRMRPPPLLLHAKHEPAAAQGHGVVASCIRVWFVA